MSCNALGDNALTFILLDWSDAYKHVHVSEDDLHLQIISWGGKLFVDRSLTFGSKSSPGIYDRISGVVRDIANIRAGHDRREGFKCLDDTGVIGTEKMCRCFFRENSALCGRIGVRLAPTDDPEKAFDAATSGTILGLIYDSISWTWTFCESKITKMELLLHEILENDTMELHKVKSLAGKLNHYWPVISPRGRWERGFIVYKASDQHKGLDTVVDTSEPNLKRQALFWLRHLQLARKGLPIPDPVRYFRSDPYVLFPDAAGASASNLALGMGGVAWNVPGRPMMMMAWPLRLRLDNVVPCFQSKLTMLEAAAALATFVGVVGNLRGHSAVVYTDNAGLAHAWRRGHSRCGFTYTLMKALAEVAYYADIQLKVIWTRRCSSPGELCADLLSKGRLSEAVREAGVDHLIPMRISRTLAKWLMNPQISRELGSAISEEIARRNLMLPREPEDSEIVGSLMWSER